MADEKDANTNHPLETGNIDSTDIILESEEVIGAELSTHGISAVDNPPEPTKSLDEEHVSKCVQWLYVSLLCLFYLRCFNAC